MFRKLCTLGCILVLFSCVFIIIDAALDETWISDIENQKGNSFDLFSRFAQYKICFVFLFFFMSRWCWPDRSGHLWRRRAVAVVWQTRRICGSVRKTIYRNTSARGFYRYAHVPPSGSFPSTVLNSVIIRFSCLRLHSWRTWKWRFWRFTWKCYGNC